MSLDTVVEDITEEARARATEIREEAEQRAEEVRTEAKGEAEAIRSQREDAIERQIDQEREQRLSSAKLEAKQKRLEARRDTLSTVRDSVEERLASMDGERRKELTRSLLSAAAAEFDDDSVEVYARSEDEDLISELLEDEEFDGFSYAGEYDCLGGVVVESDTSRVRVNNTFDSVLEEVWDDSLQEINAELFEE